MANNLVLKVISGQAERCGAKGMHRKNEKIGKVKICFILGTLQYIFGSRL